MFLNLVMAVSSLRDKSVFLGIAQVNYLKIENKNRYCFLSNPSGMLRWGNLIIRAAAIGSTDLAAR